MLTSASCIAGKVASDFTLRVGDHDLSTTAETSATKTYKILTVKPHTGYVAGSGPGIPNDIGLLRVQRIAVSEKVGIVCLPFKFATNAFVNAAVTIAGWGLTSTGGTASTILKKIDTTVISNTVCGNSYSTLTASMMCTFTMGKDTCDADTGSAVYHASVGRTYAIGVVSSGKNCAGTSPTINTRITSFLSFIKTTATTASFCEV